MMKVRSGDGSIQKMDFHLAQASASTATSNLMQGTVADQQTDLFPHLPRPYIELDSSMDPK